MEVKAVDVPDRSYEVMKHINESINTIYHTARVTNSTISEAKNLKSRAKSLVDMTADYMRLLLRITRIFQDKDAAVKFNNEPNLHRLVEFVFFWWHSIEFSVVYIAELIFEKYHQLL